jgi:hypothetical protein
LLLRVQRALRDIQRHKRDLWREPTVALIRALGD